jgi:putative chitinase
MDAKGLASAMGIPLARAQKWEAAMNMAFEYAEINNPLRQAAFLAQVGHETQGLVYVKELGNDKYLSKYDTGKLAAALGNTPEADGDGQKYAGRGLIQVTGRANYRACSRALFGDDRLLENPQQLEQPEWAAKSAAWYWKKNGLNALADQEQFTTITRKINGGINGLSDRIERYKLAKSKIAA